MVCKNNRIYSLHEHDNVAVFAYQVYSLLLLKLAKEMHAVKALNSVWELFYEIRI